MMFLHACVIYKYCTGIKNNYGSARTSKVMENFGEKSTQHNSRSNLFIICPDELRGKQRTVSLVK